MSVRDISLYEIVSHTAGTHAGSLLPVNLCSCLGVALSLPHAEGLLLLTDLLQPLLLQEQHQRVPHVHHLDQPLEDLLFFCTLLWGLLWQTNTAMTLLARLSAETFTTFRTSTLRTTYLHELPEFQLHLALLVFQFQLARPEAEDKPDVLLRLQVILTKTRKSRLQETDRSPPRLQP